MKKIILLTFTLLAFYSIADAQKEGLVTIGKNDLKAYMEFFASDDMAGRETGTVQNEVSALFIKSNIMRLGLKPLPGTGSYLQKMPLVSTMIQKNDTYLKIINDQGGVVFSTDSLISLAPPSKTMDVTGNVVFAGYAFEDSASGYNDFDVINIKGKIVLVMTRTPELVKSGSGKRLMDFNLETKKISSLFGRQPKAILFVYDPLNGFNDGYESGLAELIRSSAVTIKGKEDFSVPLQLCIITQQTADLLLKPTGYSLSGMQDRIRKDGKPVSVEIKGITATVRTAVETIDVPGSNVIGIIEGSDPVLKNECIVYSAHFDHTGISEKGEVYNGADDNASGSMALLEIAEAFMNLKKKPLRTIVFAWVNGEEKGMLGSQYYTDNPVIPMEKTVANINLDMVGRSRMASDTGKLYGMDLAVNQPGTVTQPGEVDVYTAHESSELLKIMNSASLEAGIKLNDKGANMPFGSSDHESFIAKGVPALFFNSGVHRDLHNLGDDVEKIDFDKMEKSAKVAFLIGYKISSQQKRIVVDNPQ
jgi:hypothetical protein